MPFLRRANPQAHAGDAAAFRPGAGKRALAQPPQQRGGAAGRAMSGAKIKGWCPSLFEPDGGGRRFSGPGQAACGRDQRGAIAAAGGCGAGIWFGADRDHQPGEFSVAGVFGANRSRLCRRPCKRPGSPAPIGQAERRRNIVVACPLAPEMMAVARRLEAWLEQDDGVAGAAGEIRLCRGRLWRMSPISASCPAARRRLWFCRGMWPCRRPTPSPRRGRSLIHSCAWRATQAPRPRRLARPAGRHRPGGFLRRRGAHSRRLLRRPRGNTLPKWGRCRARSGWAWPMTGKRRDRSPSRGAPGPALRQWLVADDA